MTSSVAEKEPSVLRVAVVEDDRDSRESLVYLIDQGKDMTCVAAVASAEEGLRLIPASRPDLILLDIQLAGKMDGIDCLEALRILLPDTQIVMLTCNNSPDVVFSCLMRGATGYLHKSFPPEALPSALREVAAGGSAMSPEIARLVTGYFHRLEPVSREWERLTSREQEILALLTRGLLKKEIADQLGISEETVRTHCSHIYHKLHVSCREHAVAKVIPFDAFPKPKPAAKRRPPRTSNS